MSEPSLSVIKALFAASGNVCAFPPCEERLTDPGWQQVNADVAHIRGKKIGSARYDPSMSDEERDSFGNLLLLCPNHHRMIDRLQPEAYSVVALLEMKAKHEERCKAARWASDEDIELFGRLAAQEALLNLIRERPRLRVEKSARDHVEVVNFGDDDAFDVDIELDEATTLALVRPDESPASRLSPGARWEIGILAMTFGNAGPHAVRVRWRDSEGRHYDGDFPI